MAHGKDNRLRTALALSFFLEEEYNAKYSKCSEPVVERMEMARVKQQDRITALYGRLSRDDEFSGDSMSIQTQRTMLMQYASEKGFTNCRTFMDDGFSGTNFNRPAFQELLDLVRAGKVAVVIVKDLSRLGREYLQTGYYTEVVFPEYNTRFIAINDNVDSMNGDNEFAPFKNIINEWYAKDCSRKTRSAFRTKALSGEFTGGYPAFGYQKDPENRHHLIPNEYASVVKRMYQMALEGTTCFHIAKTLEAEKVPTPRAYIMDKFGKYVANERVKHPYAWCKTTVMSILSNPVYLGKIVSQRYKTRSFKDKRIVPRPKEDWITVENTHEPLVDQETFDTVQERIKIRQPATWANSDNMFRGLVFCGECNTRMVYSSRQGRKSRGHFCCNKHRRYGGKECSAHYITLEQVNELLLEDIRRHAHLAAADKEKYVDYLTELSEREMSGERVACRQEKEQCQKRLNELNVLLKRLYEDKVFGRISEDRYAEMTADYEVEAEKLRNRAAELDDVLTAFHLKDQDSCGFARLVEQYTDITELTAELLHTLIDKIVVHEKQVVNGKIVMRVEIYYRFIGSVGDSRGEGMLAPEIRRRSMPEAETESMTPV